MEDHYAAKNPGMGVPAIETDDGKLLTTDDSFFVDVGYIVVNSVVVERLSRQSSNYPYPNGLASCGGGNDGDKAAIKLMVED